jgi:hypothetical protein
VSQQGIFNHCLKHHPLFMKNYWAGHTWDQLIGNGRDIKDQIEQIREEHQSVHNNNNNNLLKWSKAEKNFDHEHKYEH